MRKGYRIAENTFFGFQCLKGSRTKFECSQYGDSKTIVFSAKHAIEEEFVIQIWDRSGESLSFQHKMFREHLANAKATAMNRPEGGRTVLDVNFSNDGTFTSWKGCCVEDLTSNGVFCDYELLGETTELVASARCFVNHVRNESHLIVQRVLATLRVELPSMWMIGTHIVIRDIAA